MAYSKLRAGKAGFAEAPTAVIHRLWNRRFRVGDRVVFRKPKHGTAPGPRAKHIAPSRCGEDYNYEVEKFWIVEEVLESTVVVRTRRGKRHVLEADDQRLRPAHWWERLLFGSRFPDPGHLTDASGAPST